MSFVDNIKKTDDFLRFDYLDSLKTSLKDTIKNDFYSVGKYKEEAACIENDETGWIVYEGERGQRHNARKYMDGSEACHDLISRVSESDEQEERIKLFFDVVTYRDKKMKNHLLSCSKFVPYNYSEAIRLMKYGTDITSDDVIEAHISMGCNKRQLRSFCVKPHILENTVKVLVLAKDSKAREAEEAGADYVGGEDIASKIKNDGWLDFDVLVAAPDMIDVVSSIDFILKPRGLMPTSEAGTITKDVAKKVTDIKNYSINYKLGKGNIVCVPVGKACFTEETLRRNFNSAISDIIRATPQMTDKQCIKDVQLTSKKGFSVKVDLGALEEELCIPG